MLHCCSCLHVVLFFFMIPRPTRTTRTDTLLPYTTLFRSRNARPSGRPPPRAQLRHRFFGDVLRGLRRVDHAEAPRLGGGACAIGGAHAFEALVALALDPVRAVRPGCKRSEERRVGEECVSTCRSRGAP